MCFVDIATRELGSALRIRSASLQWSCPDISVRRTNPYRKAPLFVCAKVCDIVAHTCAKLPIDVMR